MKRVLKGKKIKRKQRSRKAKKVVMAKEVEGDVRGRSEEIRKGNLHQLQKVGNIQKNGFFLLIRKLCVRVCN
jgi:hypothetical protein